MEKSIITEYIKLNMKRIVICSFAALLALSAVAPAFALESNGIEAMSAKPKKELITVVYDVHLHCESCVNKVVENLSYEKGVKDLKVSLEDQTVTVTFDPKKTDETKIMAAIEALGYKAKKHLD